MTTELQTAGVTPGLRSASARSFVVPLDGTEQALAAVRVARALAEVLGGTVHLVHASAGAAVPLPQLVSALRLRPGELVGSVVDELSGAPAERILALADTLERPLVVMSSEAEGEAALGPVAGTVLERGSFPVVLLKPQRLEAPWSLTHVLLPHDGAPSTASALGPVLGLAERAGAQLTVLHVAGLASAGQLPAYEDQPQYEWPAWSRRFLERLAVGAGVGLQASAQLALAHGDPGPEIVRFAARHEVDLVGLTGAGAAFQEVVRRCSCPVMALR